MSDRTYLNLDFLRKDAKSLLKHYRSGEQSALDRVHAQIPNLKQEVQLADIQHVIAREAGYVHWGELKRSLKAPASGADFTRPGSEGQLPDGFVEWQNGATHTVWPEMLEPLRRGQEYYMYAGVWGRVPKYGEFTGYGTLYRKAKTIVATRMKEFTCGSRGAGLHNWVAGHAWFRKDVPSSTLVAAFLSVGLLYPESGQERPKGVSYPEEMDLTSPGGMTPNEIDPKLFKRPAEGYVDFMQDPANGGPDIAMLSYGEYVPNAEGLNYEPFVRRAEERARFSLRVSQKGARPLRVIRRQWFCATNPDIAVVHVYFSV
jgi:hypothetical protein